MKDAEKAARDTLDQLIDKGLLGKQKPTLEGKGDVVLFRPYGADSSNQNVNTFCKTRLEDDPHWQPKPEKR